MWQWCLNWRWLFIRLISRFMSVCFSLNISVLFICSLLSDWFPQLSNLIIFRNLFSKKRRSTLLPLFRYFWAFTFFWCFPVATFLLLRYSFLPCSSLLILWWATFREDFRVFSTCCNYFLTEVKPWALVCFWLKISLGMLLLFIGYQFNIHCLYMKFCLILFIAFLDIKTGAHPLRTLRQALFEVYR